MEGIEYLLMQKTLDTKLKILRCNPGADTFILADAKDADMAFGIASPGRDLSGRSRSIADYRDQIREIVRQGLVDIVLMSASTSETLTIHESIFASSAVTPAARANDATDIHIVRGGAYASAPSRPFASATIDQIQYGRVMPDRDASPAPGANLGLYSITFNNDPENDLATMEAYKAFRIEAEQKGFEHFLEIFAPNVPAEFHRLQPDQIASFVNDHIVRLLAGVPSSSRPRFLKIPYFGPAAMEELSSYDPTLIVGVLGGSAGTTHDAFHLLWEARRYGARVALFGRKINAAEHQLTFIQHLRRVADGHMQPEDAVKSYHGELFKLKLKAKRPLQEDLELTATYAAYASSPSSTQCLLTSSS